MGTQAIDTWNERRVDACQEILRRYDGDGEVFLRRIVTGNESWVHFYEPERKGQSMEWRHTSSPKSKKVRVQRPASKFMLTFFWNYSGPILEYMPRGSTVTSATYSNLRKNWTQLFARNGAGCWRQGCPSSTTMRSHILLQQQCRLLRSCGLRAYHTLRTHPTSRRRIFTSSVHWRCAEWNEVPGRRWGAWVAEHQSKKNLFSWNLRACQAQA